MDGNIKSNVMPLMPMVRGKPEPVPSVSPVPPEQELPGSGNQLPQAKEKVSDKEVVEAVSNLNDYIQVIRRELEFRVDKETGRTVVTVLDAETGEKIRQIPSEEVLALARNLDSESTTGLILSADT